MSLYRADFPSATPNQFEDVWDAMMELWTHKYSPELYEHFRPLFDVSIRDVQRRFDRLIQLFPDALPYDFRTLLMRAHRQLNTERIAYLSMPSWLADERPGTAWDQFFNVRFQDVIKVLRDVARDADRRRQALAGEDAA